MRNFFVFVLPRILLVIALALSSFLAYEGYHYKQKQETQYAQLQEQLRKQNENIQKEIKSINSLIASLASTTRKLRDTTESQGEYIAFIEDKLEITRQESSNLSEAVSATLSEEQKKSALLEQKISQIDSTVGTLDKLSKTDPELLQKYSKVFFLNEHYVPPRLSEIEKKYLYDESRAQLLRPEVLPYLVKLLDDALADSTIIYVKSAYRSFDEQSAIKSAYSVTYGAGSANQFSADQGYSEHQLGTTVDFITTGLGGKLTGFEKTKSYEWLNQNAYKYGFILSYHENNSYYIHEPWHWRFVGVALAKKLHDEHIGFYEMDQRAIDDYLVSIFD